MSAASEREALLKAFGVSNGTQVWVEFQGGPDELLATLHALGFTRQSRAEIQAEAVEGAVKYAATDEHVGMTRDEAIAYEAALDLFRDYAQRIREGEAVADEVEIGSCAACATAAGHDPSLAVHGDWIVQDVGQHTCGAGPGSGAGHEPGCGTEPVMKIADLEALGFVRRMERDALVEVIAEHICRVLNHEDGGDECEADYEAAAALADELIARQFPAETTLLPRCVNTGSLITSPRCPTCNGSGITGSLAGVSECGQCGGCGHICDEMARQPYSAALAAVRSLPTSRTAAWGRGWDSVSLADVVEILKAGDDE